MKIFEDYLKRIHAKGYTGTDDDMSEDFNEHWLYRLDKEELIQYAEDCIEEIVNDDRQRILNKFR